MFAEQLTFYIKCFRKVTRAHSETLVENIFVQTYLGIKYIKRFWKTQKIPTHKSAPAKFARKKFVVDRNLLLMVTTRITIRLPEKKTRKVHKIHITPFPSVNFMVL